MITPDPPGSCRFAVDRGEKPSRLPGVAEEIGITEDEEIVAVCARRPSPVDSCAGLAVAPSSTRRLGMDRCIQPLGAEDEFWSSAPKLKRNSLYCGKIPSWTTKRS